MENFTPLSGAIGGVLIGFAAVIFAATTGRIAGISGILGNALGAKSSDLGWRLAFLGGLIAAPLLISLIAGYRPVVDLQASWPLLAIAGFIVGVGTRVGNGCTSGHGVCGIGLGSPRSIVATVVFFTAAVATVFVARHLLG